MTVVIIHVGTKTFRSSTSVRDYAAEMVNLASRISIDSSADLAILGSALLQVSPSLERIEELWIVVVYMRV